MKRFTPFIALMAALMAMCITSCKHTVSYAELLQNENYSVNRYLANHRVVGEVPADSVFITGEDAPYYQMDQDGNIYMQVIDPGDPDQRPEAGDVVYFRFLAANLNGYTTDANLMWAGNAFNLDQVTPTSFRFQNYTLQSSYQWGRGLQTPMYYLGYNCEVNLVIKSQFGPTDNQSYVYPYVYRVRYYKSMI